MDGTEAATTTGLWDLSLWIPPLVTSLICTLVGFLLDFALNISDSRSDRLKDYLDHSESRQILYDQLSGRRTFGRYRARIRGLNALFDRWQGGIGSRKQFGWCLRVAFIYPIALFAIAWLFGGSGELAGFDLLPPDQGFLRRLVTLSAVLAIGFGYIFLLANLDKIQSFITRILLKIFGLGDGSSTPIRRNLIGVLALAGAVAAAATLLTFYVALPMANAGIDWLSWTATRWFLRRMERIPEGWAGAALLTAEIVIDLGIAILCLIALAVFLPNVIEALNMLFESLDDAQTINWQIMVETAIRAPLSEGLLVTGMLFTTLIPTIIHLVYGVGGVLFSFTPSAKKAAELFPAEGEAWNPINRDDVIKTLQMQRYWLAIALPITIAFVLVIVWGVFSFIGQFGLTLQSIALWSTAWSR